MTIYRPVHANGALGPRFATATHCCLWIMYQPDSALWSWTQHTEANPPELSAA